MPILFKPWARAWLDLLQASGRPERVLKPLPDLGEVVAGAVEGALKCGELVAEPLPNHPDRSDDGLFLGYGRSNGALPTLCLRFGLLRALALLPGVLRLILGLSWSVFCLGSVRIISLLRIGHQSSTSSSAVGYFDIVRGIGPLDLILGGLGGHACRLETMDCGEGYTSVLRQFAHRPFQNSARCTVRFGR